MSTLSAASKLKRQLRLPLAAAGAIALGIGAMSLAGAGVASAAGPTTYQANLQPVALNTPAAAASGTLTLTLNGDQATVTEQVSGLGATIPTDPTTLASLGIPAGFAGMPFPHVQHIHINGADTCPTASADTNGDGVISTVEGQPAYGMIGTTLSTSGATDASTATDVTVAPSGASFTYNRTFTVNQATLSAIQASKAVIVVHGLNPSTAPAASLTTANSLNATLPGASKPVALIATAPALCGVLTASQMSAVPSGAPSTGGGSTANVQDLGLFAAGGALVLGGSALLFARRRRSARSTS
ncbi:MAG: hypothetical protein ACRDVP_09180 [Acidimicrobiales bacterium]